MARANKADEQKSQQIIRDLRTQLDASQKNLTRREKELQKVHEEHKIGGNYGQGKGRSYDEIEARNAELEKENKKMTLMSQTLVVHNRAAGTFEFIG